MKIKAFFFGSFNYFLYLCRVNKIFNLPLCNLSEKVAKSFGSLLFPVSFLRPFFPASLCLFFPACKALERT